MLDMESARGCFRSCLHAGSMEVLTGSRFGCNIENRRSLVLYAKEMIHYLPGHFTLPALSYREKEPATRLFVSGS